MNTLRKNWERLRNKLRGHRLPVLSPQEGYDRWAASYEENMNPVQVLEAEALARLLPDLHDRVVLDLGCGKGRVSRLALERGARETVGVDISEAMLKAASAALPTPTARWVRAQGQTLPFDAASFDVVVCALMMGHVEDLETALSEIARVLRPGGVLLLSDFHPYATLRGWQRAFTDVESGQAFAIKNYPHMFDAYLRCFSKQNIVLETLEEPCYEGYPVVFVMRARKESVKRET